MKNKINVNSLKMGKFGVDFNVEVNMIGGEEKYYHVDYCADLELSQFSYGDFGQSATLTLHAVSPEILREIGNMLLNSADKVEALAVEAEEKEEEVCLKLSIERSKETLLKAQEKLEKLEKETGNV